MNKIFRYQVQNLSCEIIADRSASGYKKRNWNSGWYLSGTAFIFISMISQVRVNQYLPISFTKRQIGSMTLWKASKTLYHLSSSGKNKHVRMHTANINERSTVSDISHEVSVTEGCGEVMVVYNVTLNYFVRSSEGRRAEGTGGKTWTI